MTPQQVAPMNRLDLTRRILNVVDDDMLLVAGIGNAGFDLFSAGDRPSNFYMLGSMGMAIPIALGLALAQPERSIIVMEGEGSVLMNLGGLATVGRESPPNLTIVIWDNAQWQLTGGQPLATASTCDLVAVALACGITQSTAPLDPETFGARMRYALDAPGPHLLVARIDASPAAGRHHDDPVYLKHRFMSAINVQPD